MRLLVLDRPSYLERELTRIGVHPAAHAVFEAKRRTNAILIQGISAARANVLKQIALVAGADLAVPREVYFGARRRLFSAILFATPRQIKHIADRLAEQSWLAPMARELQGTLSSISPLLRIGARSVVLDRTLVMGILNITPDSFYAGSRVVGPAVEAEVESMCDAGADLLDIGAESTRPGARPLTAAEEIARLKPVLRKVIRRTRIPVSVDTYKARVAEYALSEGARIVNDITALRGDRLLAGVVARHRATLVLMHMKGRPRTMQRNPHYADVMAEIHRFFAERLTYARARGIAEDRLIIDPGLGFGKRLEDNYEIINRLAEFQSHGRPILVGHSRKSFIGAPDGLPPEERLYGTVAVTTLLINNGASILRVHDVAAAKQAARLIDRMAS